MKFKANTRRRALEYEKDLVQHWKENKTFEKSIELRPKENSYVFYDGPPFISGIPHHGTLLSSVVKDAVPRYQTMKGKRVERVWGWDAHGLPAERYTEKKLGITSRQEVIEYGIEKYILATRANMLETSSAWEDTIDRIGRWVDFKGAYKTMDKDYMESIWWAFKTLYEKGKIYEGEKVLMYCTLDATPLSKAEVTMDAGAYQDVTDPSVYTKFKLVKPNKTSVAFYITNENGDFLAVKRNADDESLPNVWGLPAATLRAGEDVESAVIRAASEKLGISVQKVEFEGLERIERRDYFLDLSEFRITKYEGTPTLQNGKEFYAELGWQSSPEVLREAAEKGSLCSRIFLRNRNIEFIDTNEEFEDQYLLAWTTTPWTLPANTALAINPDIEYVRVLHEGTRYILAKDLVETVFTDEKHRPLEYTIQGSVESSELLGKTYEPLFGDRGDNAHKIWAADYVTTESGTGIVHIAPAYGEEDFALAREKNIPVVHVLDENGEYTETEWKGENVWAINKTIAKTLLERGVVWKIDYFRHSYPHCHRCGTKLMYRAHPSWFMDIDSQRTQMLEQNGDINWFPEHVKHGRFEKTVETAPDWNISRDRFWATAMPVWKGTDSDGVEHVKVIGSYAELKELSGQELEDYHRPWIDDVTFEIDGVTYTRIDKVMDSWFEAGSMPFAQFHYPFENKQKFEENFPGDFIVEYIGQVRAWFYYMHAMSVALFGENSFKNVVVTGNVAGNDGRKMSKSYGNYTDPNELMDKFSADSLRFLLLSSPLLSGEDFALQDKEVGDVARKLSMVWNMYDFFTMYADVDGWEYDGELCDPSERLENPLDIWVVSRVHQLIQEIEHHMDSYDIPNAMKPILPFIDDASNWFVRRSRRRFWKSDDTADKENAYVTLHYVLVRLSQALAPFTPFLAEELFRNLTGEESVHLTDWPEVGHVNELVVRDMETVRDYVNQALSLRAAAKLKIRQPLASVTIPNAGEFVDFEDVLIDELNVKKVIVGGELAIDTELTPELVREGVSREIIRYIQAARKNAGLNVDDRITLFFATTNPAEDIFESFKTHNAQIMSETLAVAMSDTKLSYTDTVTIDGEEVVISLEKA